TRGPGSVSDAERDAGDGNDPRKLPKIRHGGGHHPRRISRAYRELDAPQTPDDARGACQRGGVRGVRQGQRDDRYRRQSERRNHRRVRTTMANTGPNPGQVAPEIDLLDGNGERWMLSGARGRVVALFFYLGDVSPVCTKQMCSVRDNWSQYQQTGAEV